MGSAWPLDEPQTREFALRDLQSKLSYDFRDLTLLEKCLLAADTNSPDREGNRGLSQLGDSLMGFVVMSDGIERHLPRAKLQDASSEVRSRDHCGRIAKVLRLDQWLKLSKRQAHAGVQPATLKHAVAALIGAVWLDSHDYLSVLKVMLNIGLLNFAQHHDQVQEDAEGYQEVADNSFDEYWEMLPEADRTVDDGISLQTPSSHDSPIHTISSVCSPNSRTSNDNLSGALQSARSYSVLSDHDSAVQSACTMSSLISSPGSSTAETFLVFTPSDSDTPDPPSQSQVYEPSNRELTPMLTGGITRPEANAALELHDVDLQGTSLLHPSARVTSQRPGTQKNSGVKKPTGRKGNRKPAGRPRADNPATLIHNYVESEDRKAGDVQCYVNLATVMQMYQTMILKAPSSGQAGLAALAISVGESSALSILKAAVKGLRSQNFSDNIRVDRAMSIEDRLQVIQHTGGCIELLRLARVLHILALWRDLTTVEHGGGDTFVISTPQSLSAITPKPGNPIHIGKANVARGMTDLANGSGSATSASVRARLRRLGQRFDRLVRAWGEGVLLLLGQPLSEARILDPRDGDFDGLIELMDIHEGPRIREISKAAEHVLCDLRAGNSQGAQLELEAADDEILREIPRLSHRFMDLLRPSSEDVDSVSYSESCASPLST